MKTTNINAPYTEENPDIKSYLKQIRNPFLQRFYLLAKLPAALFMGVNLIKIDPKKAVVKLPYRWRSQNPFKSTYFAAQAAAAEFSTGVLAVLALQGRGRISMLVADLQADFTKKANNTIYFTCDQGEEIIETVKRAIATKEGQTIKVNSTGRMKDKKTGEEVIVSRFTFTWTFKAK